MRDLSGCNAILTGASRGLGVLMAHALAKEGVNLALAARSADALERVKSEISGVQVIAVPTDVVDEAQQDALIKQTEDQLGPIDILVNNAGIEATHEYHTYPPEEIRRLIDVNLTAPMLLTRKVLPGMLERGRGHIVQIASLAGKGGFPCQAPYAASKAGLIMFTHTLRAELVDTPVGTSVVCPGFVADEGMYADMKRETGVEVSPFLGVSKPEKVSAAVIRAIKRDAAELIVNPVPMRPVLVASQAFPGVASNVLKVLGVTKLARRVAQTQSRASKTGDPRGE